MLKNNTPAKNYIYIENLVITYGSQIYIINNMYTKDKYIYWDIKDVNNLKTFNVRQSQDNLILILKNDNGQGYEMQNDSVIMTYDGVDKKTLINKLNVLNRASTINTENLNEIDKEVKLLSDDISKNNTFNDAKETFNACILQLNNKLINLNLLIKNNTSDNLLSISEKSNINHEYSLFSQKLLEVLQQVELLITLYSTYNTDIDENVILLVESIENELNNLNSKLNIQIDNLVTSQSETINNEDIIEITCNLTLIGNKIVDLKEGCSNLIYLGMGNTLVDTVNDLSYRLDLLTNRIDEIQENVTSGYEEEKQNVQNIINNDININNKINNLLYSFLTNNNEMTPSQSTTISTYCNDLKNNINNLISVYEIYYVKDVLDEELKFQFKVSMDNFKLAQENMINYITENKKDLIFTSKEYEEYYKYLVKHRECRSKLSSKFMSVINLSINSQGLNEIDEKNIRIDNLYANVNSINERISNINQQLIDFDARLKILEG